MLGVSPAYCRFSRPNIRFEVAVPSNQNFISLTNASIRGTDPNKGFLRGFGVAIRGEQSLRVEGLVAEEGERDGEKGGGFFHGSGRFSFGVASTLGRGRKVSRPGGGQKCVWWWWCPTRVSRGRILHRATCP